MGKVVLLKNLLRGNDFFSFAGIPPTPDVTEQSQRDVFAEQLGKQIGLSGIQMQDWAGLFSLLAQQVSKNSDIILFDEISWMGSKDPTFLGKLKNAWDLELKKNPQLILIFCGSISTWIEKKHH